MRAACRASAACAAGALWLLAASTDALAHSTNKRVGDFYAGMLHPITTLEHALPFLALGLLAGQQGGKAQGLVPGFALALMAGAIGALWFSALPGVVPVNLASTVLLGGMVAWARPFPLGLLYALAIGLGLTHGYANGEAITAMTKPYLFIPGLGFAGLLLPGYGLIMVDYVMRQNRDWMRIAVRVVGSWIAAIGILVIAASAKAILRV